MTAGARWAVLLLLALSACRGENRTTNSPGAGVPGVRVTTLTEEGGRVDWSRQNVIAFDRRGADGYFDVFRMNPDGSGQVCLTCDRPGFPTHHMGNPAWHPSGAYIVFQAQKDEVSGPLIDALATPGAGVNNDLWVMDSGGGRAWQLTDVPVAVGGVLHPHFSNAGDRLLWSQRIGGDGRYGEWAIQIAEFVVEAGIPRVRNIRTLRPGTQRRFYETHGFTPDDRQILFSGNLEPGQDELFIDVYRLDVQSGELVNLTRTGDQWDEHAQPSPRDGQVVWMSSRGLPTPVTLDSVRTDYWMMNADGSNPRRLTTFNQQGSDQFIPGGAIAGDLAWSPDGSRIAAYVIVDASAARGRIVLVSFDSPQSTETETPPVQESSRGTVVAPQSIGDLRAWDARVDWMLRQGDLARTSLERDRTGDGRVIERFVQLHRGVPVAGGEVVRQTSALGQTVSLSAVLHNPSLDPLPHLSESEAIAVFESLRGFRLRGGAKPTLAIEARADGSYALVYRAAGIRGSDAGWLTADARTGRVLEWKSELPDAPVSPLPASAVGLLHADADGAVARNSSVPRASACIAQVRATLAPEAETLQPPVRVLADASDTQAVRLRYVGQATLAAIPEADAAPGASDDGHQLAHALVDTVAGTVPWDGDGAEVRESFARALTEATASVCAGRVPRDLGVERVLYRALRLMPRAAPAALARSAVSQAAADVFGIGTDRPAQRALSVAGLP